MEPIYTYAVSMRTKMGCDLWNLFVTIVTIYMTIYMTIYDSIQIFLNESLPYQIKVNSKAADLCFLACSKYLISIFYLKVCWWIDSKWWKNLFPHAPITMTVDIGIIEGIQESYKRDFIRVKEKGNTYLQNIK